MRQADLLSRLLFTLGVDVVSQSISRVVVSGLTKGVKVQLEGIVASFAFTDATILFLGNDVDSFSRPILWCT